jgi:hypothetical protein
MIEFVLQHIRLRRDFSQPATEGSAAATAVAG